MNIQKILDSKTNKIEKEFNILKENFTPVNHMNFLDVVKESDVKSILNSSEKIASVSAAGMNFLNSVLKSNDIALEECELKHQKKKLSNLKESCIVGGYSDIEHLNAIQEGINILEEAVKKGSMLKPLQKIGKAIISPATNDHAKSAQQVIDTNLKFYTKVRGLSERDALLKIKNTHQKNIDKNSHYFEKKFDVVVAGANYNESVRQSVLLSKKVVSLCDQKLKSKPIKESFDSIIDELEEIEDMLNDVTDEDLQDIESELMGDLELTEESFTEFIYENFLSEDDVTLENLSVVYSYLEEYRYKSENYEMLQESIKEKAAKAIDKGSRAATTAAGAAIKKGEKTKTIISKAGERVDNLVNGTINKIKKLDSNKRREKLLQGGTRMQILRVIRTAITSGAAYAINPVLGGITLLTSIAMDKNLDRKERIRLLRDLEQELKIVEEKIDDAKSEGDKKNKYNLMRIHDKLENDIAKVKYRLKV